MRFLPVLFSLLVLLPLAAEDTGLYTQGLKSFRDRNFQGAYDQFLELSERDEPNSGDALFWAGKAAMALENWDQSSLLLDRFLAFQPDSRYFEEAYYLRGRVLFLNGYYEESLDSLLNFMEDFRESPFIPNALYWTAESLYQLGKIEEATYQFQRIVTDYPDSYKVEAARYRLSLISLSGREQKLVELLRWSHEEFLKSSQDTLEKKKEYEEALRAYQNQILSLTEKEQFFDNRMALLELRGEALDLKEFFLKELERLEQ